MYINIYVYIYISMYIYIYKTKNPFHIFEVELPYANINMYCVFIHIPYLH